LVINLQEIFAFQGWFEDDIAEKFAGQRETAARFEAQEAIDSQQNFLR
jgi:hypothetical protein